MSSIIRRELSGVPVWPTGRPLVATVRPGPQGPVRPKTARSGVTCSVLSAR